MSRPDLVGETHLVADEPAELGAELLGDALGDGAGGDAARLGVGDPLAAQLEQNLGQLGRLARPGLARDDDDLVVANGGGDVVAPLRHRQVSRVVDARHGAARGRSHEPFSLGSRSDRSARRFCARARRVRLTHKVVCSTK